MTWVLYEQTLAVLEGQAKKKFLRAAEDWDGLRAMEAAGFKETDLGTGGI